MPARCITLLAGCCTTSRWARPTPDCAEAAPHMQMRPLTCNCGEITTVESAFATGERPHSKRDASAVRALRHAARVGRRRSNQAEALSERHLSSAFHIRCMPPASHCAAAVASVEPTPGRPEAPRVLRRAPSAIKQPFAPYPPRVASCDHPSNPSGLEAGNQ